MLKVGNERNADGGFLPLSSPHVSIVCVLSCSTAQVWTFCFEVVSHSGFTQSMWQDDPPLSVQACTSRITIKRVLRIDAEQFKRGAQCT